jgi:uncharacterized protein YecE (DUF72 family)
MSDVRIGISGWTYAPWRSVFFPKTLPQNQELGYAARQVRSIEINGTFYSLQRPSSYLAWYNQTPADFLFSVKGPRFITHLKRLKEVEIPLANFLASGVLRLNEKLGPILWQFPPHFRFNAERLAQFFKLLPRETEAAAALSRRHDHHLKHGSWTKTDENRPLRHAIEIRHESFQCPEFIALLREHAIALVVADTAGKWPLMDDVTADFVYVRLHGDAELYVSGYTPEALQRWAGKIAAWRDGRDAPAAKLHAATLKPRSAGRDVYAYFDNDVKTHAPFDAMALAHLLGLAPPPPSGTRAEISPRTNATPRTRWPDYGTRVRRTRASSAKPKTKRSRPTASTPAPRLSPGSRPRSRKNQTTSVSTR